MPNREFLETYPLFRKIELKGAQSRADYWEKVAINMPCSYCGGNETFVQRNEFYQLFPYSNYSVGGEALYLLYICTSCGEFKRHFLIRIAEDLKSMMKIGQFPAWEIKPDPTLEKFLGSQANHYKKGLVCESQGYGIGAYAYYRRIVELKIDELLTAVEELLAESEKQEFHTALESVKKTTITREKIDLVKDLLPPILRPDGLNPLSVLHSALSDGLHSQSDDDCLALANTIREVLSFFVQQLLVSKSASQRFTSGMRTLLEKKK